MCGTASDRVLAASRWVSAGIGKTYANLPAVLIDRVFPAAAADAVAVETAGGGTKPPHQQAIDALQRGSAVTIFTPDDVCVSLSVCVSTGQ